jgi:two-component system CheB/CheR fusion protein
MTRKKKTGLNSGEQPVPESPVAPTSAASPPAPEREAVAPRHGNKPFPVVGIGASAGGLEALELFLQHVPAASGMAYVIVQHLDPTHKAMLPELLQRVTPMEVVQVVDRTRIRPDCVYVIPPNSDMSILHGVLHLLEPSTPRGLRLPIDFFFRSLADDLQSSSVGVILSGMGSDGTLGLRAIREKAGVAFVQDPASAKFDGMPRSAIEADVADVVAPVEALPGKIIAYLRHAPGLLSPRATLGVNDQSGLEKIAILLRVKTGHDFSLYKKSTLYRRIERRMGLHQIGKIALYIRYLQENPAELDLLFKELLIGVTSFFRDPSAWEKLRMDILPTLLAERSPDRPLRAWVPACSTGEEAYSLAIVFKEAIELLKPAANFTLQIFATDLDNDAIERARSGLFPLNIAADLSPERLLRYFVQTEQGYMVSKPIREMVIFAQQNVIMDPPFTRIDILGCRNLLIYMTPELQKKVVPLFHYSLNPGGILFLGSAETIGGFGELFESIEAKFRLYRRRDAVRRSGAVEFPSAISASRPGGAVPSATYQPAPNLQMLADRLLLQTFAPAAVLVNDQGDILYISGRTGNYLEPAAGKANWNIFAMAREGLRYELTTAFRKALRQREPVISRNIKVTGQSAGRTLDLTVQAITEPEALRGMVMVVLTEVERLADGSPKGTHEHAGGHPLLARMERELEVARHEAQCIQAEMQASQEDLKSSNEEMQSMNEELQSTNEELTTSKEEMQSMNEELQTLNHELQAKLEELSRLNSDMRNLLESTEIATLFLDDALKVRLFTAGAKMIFKLIPGDVGRLITDISSELDYPMLEEHAYEVLRTLAFHEEQVPARGAQWYRVRIMPYRTLDNRISGVVITFTDISASKMLESQLRTVQAGLEAHIATAEALNPSAKVLTPSATGKES